MTSLQELWSMRGRVVLITGGLGHLGFSLVETFLLAGARVAIADRKDVVDRNGEDLVGKLHGDYALFAVDLSDEASVRALPKLVVEHFGSVDVLVNCAAFVGTSGLSGWAVPFEHQETSTWRAALEVNLTSVFSLVQECAPLLRASGLGSIVNIGSIYGIVGPDLRLYEGTSLGNPAAYAASKGALDQMTRWWSTVLAPDVRVNCVCPGGIFRDQPAAFVERYIARTPLGRMGSESDMCGAVLFLASDMSRYVTGQTLAVDGGWTAW